MKTKEELNALKEEVENVGKKLAELTDEELEQVCGGIFEMPEPVYGNCGRSFHFLPGKEKKCHVNVTFPSDEDPCPGCPYL